MEKGRNTKIQSHKGVSANFHLQKRMCIDLGVTEQTFIKLKEKHPKIREALAYGNKTLKADVMSALKKRAVGFIFKTKVRSMKKMVEKEINNSCRKLKKKIHLM